MIFANITLNNYLVLAMILIGICIIARIFDIFILSTARKNNHVIEDIEFQNAKIRTIKKTKTDNAMRSHRILLWNMIISITCALICVFVAAIYNKIAIDYGAYGDYQSKLTPALISQMTKLSYIDQSETLPENLNGSILIYYRYDCKDCQAIHDDLMTYLSNEDMSKIYFVSTRSEKGKTLVQDIYYVNEVPTAVYIYNEPINDMTYVAGTLYTKTDDTTVFVDKYLNDLITLQKGNA